VLIPGWRDPARLQEMENLATNVNSTVEVLVPVELTVLLRLKQ
jgi:hypothetical protein